MTTPQTLRDEFKELFHEPLTAKQLWLITKFAKYVRLRARNNTAFNNLANTVFSPYARFQTVDKTKPSGEHYPGLQITVDKMPLTLDTTETISEDEQE